MITGLMELHPLQLTYYPEHNFIQYEHIVRPPICFHIMSVSVTIMDSLVCKLIVASACLRTTNRLRKGRGYVT